MQTVRVNAVVGSNQDQGHLGARAGEDSAHSFGCQSRRGRRPCAPPACGERRLLARHTSRNGGTPLSAANEAASCCLARFRASLDGEAVLQAPAAPVVGLAAAAAVPR